MISELILAGKEIESVNENALLEVQNKVNNLTDILDLNEAVFIMERLGAC